MHTATSLYIEANNMKDMVAPASPHKKKKEERENEPGFPESPESQCSILPILFPMQFHAMNDYLKNSSIIGTVDWCENLLTPTAFEIDTTCGLKQVTNSSS